MELFNEPKNLKRIYNFKRNIFLIFVNNKNTLATINNFKIRRTRGMIFLQNQYARILSKT